MEQAKKKTVADYRKKNNQRVLGQRVIRDWSKYNRGKESKHRHLWPMVSHLTSLVGQPERIGRGRPQAVLADVVFASVLKVALQLSARDFTSMIELAHHMGLISTAPRWSTVLKYMADPDMTELLRALVTISSLPGRQLETRFCADATGLSTSMYFSWNNEQYGSGKSAQKLWVKLHAIIGVETQVIVAAEATEGTVSDQTPFSDMLKRTAQEYSMDEVIADTGYISRAHLDLINDLRAVPYIPFAKHHKVPLKPSGSTWDKMIRYYVFKQDEWDSHYRAPRSRVESVFAANKQLFGPGLLSKTLPAQLNETYCRVIAHNLTRLIAVSYELDILDEVTNWGRSEPIYHDDVPDGRLSTYPFGEEAEAHECACPVHRGDVDPFWTLPGEPKPASRRSNRLIDPRRDTVGDYPNNVIYLFG